MGSITNLLGGSSSTESLGGGSSTDKITDQIAETIGDLVATALKTVLGNLS
ncbi:hypothetical protein [Dietzia alimentaria]|uniref:hypothetical protein n=1 Tax=Dietzia alimentaria TaxID=665550 RepID=UPI0002F11ECF|nr:hypothetical protein [Dietzia alimentaria]